MPSCVRRKLIGVAGDDGGDLPRVRAGTARRLAAMGALRGGRRGRRSAHSRTRRSSSTSRSPIRSRRSRSGLIRGSGRQADRRSVASAVARLPRRALRARTSSRSCWPCFGARPVRAGLAERAVREVAGDVDGGTGSAPRARRRHRASLFARCSATGRSPGTSRPASSSSGCSNTGSGPRRAGDRPRHAAARRRRSRRSSGAGEQPRRRPSDVRRARRLGARRVRALHGGQGRVPLDDLRDVIVERNLIYLVAAPLRRNRARARAAPADRARDRAATAFALYLVSATPNSLDHYPYYEATASRSLPSRTGFSVAGRRRSRPRCILVALAVGFALLALALRPLGASRRRCSPWRRRCRARAGR